MILIQTQKAYLPQGSDVPMARLDRFSKPISRLQGIGMSPDYRATQFEDVEYFGPSMTEKEFLARENLNSGIMSQVPTGTVYPGMSSLQQQFPIRSDFNVTKRRSYDELANPTGMGVPYQYSNLRL